MKLKLLSLLIGLVGLPVYTVSASQPPPTADVCSGIAAKASSDYMNARKEMMRRNNTIMHFQAVAGTLWSDLQKIENHIGKKDYASQIQGLEALQTAKLYQGVKDEEQLSFDLLRDLAVNGKPLSVQDPSLVKEINRIKSYRFCPGGTEVKESQYEITQDGGHPVCTQHNVECNTPDTRYSRYDESSVMSHAMFFDYATLVVKNGTFGLQLTYQSSCQQPGEDLLLKRGMNKDEVTNVLWAALANGFDTGYSRIAPVMQPYDPATYVKSQLKKADCPN